MPILDVRNCVHIITTYYFPTLSPPPPPPFSYKHLICPCFALSRDVLNLSGSWKAE